jgi:hypothetical protein
MKSGGLMFYECHDARKSMAQPESLAQVNPEHPF